MPNLKFDFSRHICVTDQSSSHAAAKRRTSSPWPHVPKPARGDIAAHRPLPNLYHSHMSLLDGRQDLPKFIEL